jgi:transcription elongation factor GreA
LEVLKGDRASVVEDIRQAMMDKDFRENAPLEAAKERQALIEARVRELEAAITNAQILGNEPSRPSQRAVVGAKVSLQFVDTGKKVVYTLVDVREADASSGKISTVSPVGQALLDRIVGEEVTVNVPKGTLRYVIKAIST